MLIIVIVVIGVIVIIFMVILVVIVIIVVIVAGFIGFIVVTQGLFGDTLMFDEGGGEDGSNSKVHDYSLFCLLLLRSC